MNAGREQLWVGDSDSDYRLNTISQVLDGRITGQIVPELGNPSQIYPSGARVSLSVVSVPRGTAFRYIQPMARRTKQPVVLTIAGFDPSSGAGVSADLQTFAAHGCYGIACITALTVQSTTGVRSVHPVSGKLVRETLAELAADLSIAAVKIGMLGSAEAVEAVARFLKDTKPPHVVLDPILKSSSGARLLAPAAIALLKRKLLPLCSAVTPNLDEAARLSGVRVHDAASMIEAARRLHDLGARAVIVTGGHLADPLDVVSVAEWHDPRRRYVDAIEIHGPKVRSRSTHGTGCAYSSALTANLALGMDLIGAAQQAKQYVARAIATAQPLGRGNGPLNLLWPLGTGN
jgi:hydroxymethylpyrimidine/phosphomethylpyrimidine kinase